MVIATAAILMLAICSIESPNSPLMTGISGAQANQAKKQTKKATQVRWKARMGAPWKEKSLMLSALLAIVLPLKTKRRPRLLPWAVAADAVVLLPSPRWAGAK